MMVTYNSCFPDLSHNLHCSTATLDAAIFLFSDHSTLRINSLSELYIHHYTNRTLLIFLPYKILNISYTDVSMDQTYERTNMQIFYLINLFSLDERKMAAPINKSDREKKKLNKKIFKLRETLQIKEKIRFIDDISNVGHGICFRSKT